MKRRNGGVSPHQGSPAQTPPVIAARSEAGLPQSAYRMDPATSRRMTDAGCWKLCRYSIGCFILLLIAGLRNSMRSKCHNYGMIIA